MAKLSYDEVALIIAIANIGVSALVFLGLFLFPSDWSKVVICFMAFASIIVDFMYMNYGTTSQTFPITWTLDETWVYLLNVVVIFVDVALLISGIITSVTYDPILHILTGTFATIWYVTLILTGVSVSIKAIMIYLIWVGEFGEVEEKTNLKMIDGKWEAF
jgi:hypothetical protein